VPAEWSELAVAGAMVAAAYFAFGVSGFGSGLVAIPVLTYLWPVQFVLPIMVLLDFAASGLLGWRERASTSWRELALLTPTTFLGLVAGVTLLVWLPAKLTLALLGVAVTAFGVLPLRRPGEQRPIHAAWVLPAGLVSGTASGLFGVGGAPAVIYLSRRLGDKAMLRATLAVLLLISVSVRIVLFSIAGLLGARELWTALVLLPFAVAGLVLGSRVHLRLSRVQFARFVAVLVVGAGISLVVRAAFL
jgi:uncharacterized membrane protein YfcA